MIRLALCAASLAIFAAIPTHGIAVAAPPVHYVSMRSIATEATASFVLVVKTVTAERATSISGCDGVTYYATSADAQSVAAALANGEVVHLHRGTQGQQPQGMPIKCRFG